MEHNDTGTFTGIRFWGIELNQKRQTSLKKSFWLCKRVSETMNSSSLASIPQRADSMMAFYQDIWRRENFYLHFIVKTALKNVGNSISEPQK